MQIPDATPCPTGSDSFVRRWQPAGDIRGVVCLVHGLGEHSGRYQRVAAQLGDGGFATVALDLPGHGRSPGQRGHADDYDTLLDTVQELLDIGHQLAAGAPCFLYGHSLGGNLVINAALRRRLDISGVIATSPALRPAFSPPALKLVIGRIAARVWPTLALSNELDVTALSRDPAVIEQYQNDPLVHDRISARLGIDLLASGEWAIAHAERLRLPLLLLHGTADRLTAADGSAEFAERAGARCTLKLWDGLFHELHNEPEHAEVVATIIEWLHGRL